MTSDLIKTPPEVAPSNDSLLPGSSTQPAHRLLLKHPKNQNSRTITLKGPLAHRVHSPDVSRAETHKDRGRGVGEGHGWVERWNFRL
jgi:hypothetical protein